MPAEHIVVFDCETTGVDPEQDRIVQFAAVRIGARDLRRETALKLLINPGVPIPESATAVHGITDEDVKRCPRFKDVARKIGEFIAGSDLAGHNAIAFDVVLLRAELERCGFKLATVPTRRLFDTLELFRQEVPHTLAGALAFYCDKEIGDDAHDAMVDVEATIDVLRAMSDRRDYSLDDMAKASYGSRVDLGGKLVKDDAGEACFNFGKHKGERLSNVALTSPSFMRWMLKKDFPEEVKTIVKDALTRKG